MTVPAHVAAALKRAGLPAADPDRVTRIGYSAQEVDAMERYRRSNAGAFDPMATQIR